MTMYAGTVSVFNVREHGATGDGQTLDSRPIQAAIEACTQRGGGTVYLPAGQWVDYWNPQRVLTGPADLDEPTPLERIPIFVRAGAAVLGTF